MYDLIGDIHGHAGALVELLEHLGYQHSDSGYCHPARKVIFLGDFIDRGEHLAQHKELLTIVMPMVQNGHALAVMGNHEFNVEDVELPARKNARRSIVADKPIAKGVIITSNMIGMKRPADGLSPSKIDEVIGKKTTKDIGQDELILMDFLSA